MSFDNRRSTMEGGSTGGATTGDVQSQAAVSLCKTGCGFYANAAFEGMCSKCFKDEQTRLQKLQQSSEQLLPSVVVNQQTDSNTPSQDTSHALFAAESSEVSAATACVAEILDNNATTLETGSPTVLTANSSRASMSDMSVDGEGDDSSQDSGTEKKKKTNRCHTCKKRVGLTGFECRCGGLYCSIHRYSDKHDCTFDYKELGQDQIRKNNPVVVGEKIQKL